MKNKHSNWYKIFLLFTILVISTGTAAAITIEGNLALDEQVTLIFDGPTQQTDQYRMDLTIISPTGQRSTLRETVDTDLSGNPVWDILFTITEEGEWEYDVAFTPRKNSGLVTIEEEGVFSTDNELFCGDGTCNGDEACGTCILDCGNCPLPEPIEEFCGDFVCNGDETCGTCISDCGNCPLTEPAEFCGDGTCMGDETCETCQADCGPCFIGAPVTEPILAGAATTQQTIATTTCGDGTCQSSETESSCPLDCQNGFWELSGSGSNCGNTYTGMVPLTDNDFGTHHGQQGGLYADGTNTRPTGHSEAAIAAANMIQPLDANGNPDPNGKIVLVTVGMSNVRDEGDMWVPQAMELANKNPAVVLISGGIGGKSSEKISSTGDQYPSYWNEVIQEIEENGLSANQVQAVWHKPAMRAPPRDFPGHAQTLQDHTEDIVTNVIPEFFPNTKLVYLSSRIYAGYAEGELNPEPQAYESAFAVKWTVAERNQDLLPVVTWGPYLWADGTSVGDRGARNDGFAWECSDFKGDGTHPDVAGQQKVADLLTDFFTTDTTATPWFLGEGSQPITFCGDGTCNGAESCSTCETDCGECQTEPVCGNHQIDVGEACDEENLNGKTCTTQGFDGGILRCNGCQFDTTDCFISDNPILDGFADPIDSFTVTTPTPIVDPASQVTFDVSIQDNLVYAKGYVSLNNGDWEAFDLTATGHRFGDWISQGAMAQLTFTAEDVLASDANFVALYTCSWEGSWKCRTWQAKQFDVNSIGPGPECGDGIVNQDFEACDGADLNGATCSTTGTPKCTTDCTLDYSSCADGGPIAEEYLCTQVIGFSQTRQWYADSGTFEQQVEDDNWQLLWKSGAGVDNWQSPGYLGWNEGLVSPCKTDSTAPDRVLLTVSGPHGEDVAKWKEDIEATIDNICDKYPSANSIMLQPVVGDHFTPNCGSTDRETGEPIDVRASAQHPFIDEAIAQVVNEFGGTGTCSDVKVTMGMSPEVRTCDDYSDQGGHLTTAALAPIGTTIGLHYAGDGVVTIPGDNNDQGTPTGICGDGVINQASEKCDGDDFGTETCQTQGFDSGNLICSSCSISTAACSNEGVEPKCNDGICEGNEATTCPQDCTVTLGEDTFCGDELCNFGENIDTCPWDCVPYLVPQGQDDAEELGVQGRQCDRTFTGMVPITELGAGKFKGVYQGGLYPGGSNFMPADHRAKGEAIAQNLKAIGNDDVCLISIGMSNTNQKWGRFMTQWVTSVNTHPDLKIGNGAVGSMPIKETANAGSGVWGLIDKQIDDVGCERDEVRVVWMLHAMQMGMNIEATVLPERSSFEEFAPVFKDYMRDTLINLDNTYPNLEIVYISSRSYAGYGARNNNPEPYAHTGAFVVKDIIDDQILGTEPVFDMDKGFPFLAWGPYLWADGLGPEGDPGRDIIPGLVAHGEEKNYLCDWFQSNDGIHPLEGMEDEVSKQLVEFFTTDSTATPWFMG